MNKSLETKIRNYMVNELSTYSDFYFIQPIYSLVNKFDNEINLTLLGESAINEFNISEDNEEDVFDIALDFEDFFENN